MAETRGAASIVDRVEGWGHTAASDSNREDNGTWGSASGNSLTQTDASKESTATRVARERRLRKSFAEANQVDNVDRTAGYGGDFTGIGGAGSYGFENMDAETPVSLADPLDYTYGIFRDETNSAETGTGSNTAHSTSDSEALASGRTADTRNTVQLNDGNATKRDESARTSLRDRTSGWGHTDGTYTYRND
jgi:hypothetical protein